MMYVKNFVILKDFTNVYNSSLMIILSYLSFNYNFKYEKMVSDVTLKNQAQKV